MAPKRSVSSSAPSPPAKKTRSSSNLSKDAHSSSKRPSSAKVVGQSSKSAETSSDVQVSDSSLPRSWFTSFQTAGLWKDGYHNRKLSFCEPVDVDFLFNIDLPCVNALKNSSLSKILNPGDIAYPRLTRLFYINMSSKRDRGVLTLQTIVKGKQITLTTSILAKLFLNPPDISTDSHPTRTECVSKARELFLLPNCSSSKQLTHSALKLDAKIIFLLLVRCITPRTNSRELLTDQSLEQIYLLLNNFDLDLPKIILNHMHHTISSSRSNPLPFANLLPVIFEFFQIPIDEEDIEKCSASTIGESTFSKIGIFKTSDNIWKLRHELTEEELAALPQAKGKSEEQTSFPLDRISNLEFGLDDLKNQIIDMRADFSDKLDATHELLSIIHAKVNQMFYLNALTFTATGSIMPLHEDAAQHAREKSANVLFNCEQNVRNRPILRPVRTEPTILTVEEYGVVKKYKKEEERQRAEAMKNRTFLDAHQRFRQRDQEDVRFKRDYKGGSTSNP